ncbi:MAG: YutD-like domain-containing protein [Bacilli bacterium]
MIEVDNNKYEIQKDDQTCFEKEEFLLRYTDYFKDFDYIVGDYSYGKLRLKGFNKKTNKLYRSINDFNNIDKYLINNCAYGCKYYILMKKY